MVGELLRVLAGLLGAADEVLGELVLVDPAVFPNSQADAMASGATDLLAQTDYAELTVDAIA